MPIKHKKPSSGSPILGSKDSIAKLMISFIENKSETSRRPVLQLFENMSQIELTKIPISKLKNSTLLYIATLNELMSRINTNKYVFRVTSVVLCAQMIADTARLFSQTSGIDTSIFHLLLSDEITIKLPSENEIPPFPTRKTQKLHSYSPLLAFIIRHYPSAGNVKDIFCYALTIILERMGLKQLIPSIIPQFPSEKYTLVPREKIDCANVTPESLIEISNSLRNPMDPVLVLLIRFISCKIFGPYDFHYLQINDLIDTIFEFLEENPEFDIDSLTPLLVYYKSRPVNFPIHLTYTSSNHCLFFICLGFANLFEPTTNDILLSTLSFDNAPCPSLALAFAHNLTTSFIPEFILCALKNNLTPEWNEEIKYLQQYVKLPPKREDLVEQSKTNNIDAIKILLKDPECLPLLKPDEYQSHKILSLFLKPIEFPLPEKINFERYDAALVFRLKSSKDKPDPNTIANYINQSSLMLNKMTMDISQNDKSLFHEIYSGILPLQLQSTNSQISISPAKKVSNPEFFFSPPNSPYEFGNISVIIDSLLTIIYTWKLNYDNDIQIIQNMADFNHHYYLDLNHSDRCVKTFGKEYTEVLEKQPFDHLIQAIQESKSKKQKSEIITQFKHIISAPITQQCLLFFIKKCYLLNDKDTFLNIIKLLPNITSLESSTMTNEELLDIIKILIFSDVSKNIIQISTKLIENGFSKEVFELFLTASIDHPTVIMSICNNLTKVSNFAEYFFNNSLEVIPTQINSELSSLILFLSQLVKPSEYELPSYPKVKINDFDWKEDKLKRINNEIKEKTELGTEISISIDNEPKKVTTKKINKLDFHHHHNDSLEEEEEEEEVIFDDENCDITITDNSVTKTNSSEFPFSTKNCPSIWEAPNLKHCTYIETGSKYADQPFFRCLTCNFSSNEGCCEFCAIHCHKGHRIYFDQIINCYCDCFADPSRCVSNPDHRNFVHNHPHNFNAPPKRTFGFGSSFRPNRPTLSDNFQQESKANENIKKTKVKLGSKSIIDYFLKIAKSNFIKYEINDMDLFQLKQLKSVKEFSQFNLSPMFVFPSSPTSSQFKKRISRVKNLPIILEKRSNFKELSLVCNAGNDIVCYTNGSNLYATLISQQSSRQAIRRSMFDQINLSSANNPNIPFDECVYSIISSGNSLVACLCDSVVHVVKITNETVNADNNNEQQNENINDNEDNDADYDIDDEERTIQELEGLLELQDQFDEEQINQIHLQMIQQQQSRNNRIRHQTSRQALQSNRNQPNIKFEIISNLTSPQPSLSASLSSSSVLQRTSLFIDAIFVNNSFIILLTSSYIISFNLPSGDQISIIQTDRVPFTSISLFSHQNKRYILAGKGQGQIVVYLFSDDGIISLDHFFEIDRPNSPIVVSSSPEDDLIFISSDQLPLSVLRPSDLFSASPTIVTIDSIATPVKFNSKYDTKGKGFVLLFTKTKNGGIVSVEFKSSSFIVSSLNDEVIPEDFMQPAFLGSFASSDGFFASSPDGVFIKASLSETRESHSISQMQLFMTDTPSGQFDGEAVPLTFWSRTISTDSRDFVRLFTNDVDDVSFLLEGRRNLNVPQSSTIRFTARPESSEYTIVGVRIFSALSSSSMNGRMVEMNGKTYALTNDIPTCIPLMPEEVHPGSAVSFTILPGSGMMILRSIQMHCMLTCDLTIPQKMARKKKFDWMTESTCIFDFCEESLDELPKDDEKVQIELNLARGFNDDGTIEEEYLHDLIVTMYERPQIALQCRFLISKMKFDQQIVQKIWASAMNEVIINKKIDSSQINVLWRDYTLLDPKFKKEIENVVWGNIHEQSGLSCLLSAFY